MTQSNAFRASRKRLSVGIVTYNAADVLDRALASVLQHTDADLEVVVIDGASTDGTQDVIRRHATGIAHWRSEPDNGIYDAMNKVRGTATGDWLLFLGADDELVVSVGELFEELRDPTAVYYGNVLLSGRGTVSGGRFSTYRLMQENICHQAIFYPRAVYAAKAYDTACGVLADHKYNMELWGQGQRFVHLDRVISRFSEAGVSSRGDPEFEAVKLAVIREHFGLPMFLIKRARSLTVRLLKPRHGPV